MDGAQVYAMVSGLGDAFSDAYKTARTQRQEEEAPQRLADLATAFSASRGGSDPFTASIRQSAAPSVGDAGAAQKVPSFAGGGAVMRAPGSGGATETRFVDALKAGGLTNPNGLAAMTAYANHESGFKGSNINGSWSDPSESGAPGTSGGILSWRGDRFANMRRLTAGAADPVVAQAKFALTENPELTMALQNARSPEEANSLMANAWKFAGYNRPGGENAARLASTQAYVQKLGGTPTAAQAPTAVASAEPDAANIPAPGAQPAGFVVPGQDGGSAQTTAQGFAGFGSGASRMTPEIQSALNAAWKNPQTRSIAASMFSSMLTGKDASWNIVDLGNGRKAFFDQKSARMVPVPGTGDQYGTETDADGNIFSVNQGTGQRTMLRQGKDDKFTYQKLDGVGLVALHPTDPDKSRVIFNGTQTRPLTAEERQLYGIPEGTGAGMGPDGKPFGIGGARTQVNVDTKGAGKFSEKANELQAKRYSEMVDAADNAVPLRADIDTMAQLGNQIATGKLADAKLNMAQYAKAAGFDSIADGLTGGKMGEMEAFTALADKLTPRMRVPGSGSTSDSEGRAFKNSLPSLLKTPQGNAIIADTFRGLADYQMQAGDIAGKAIRGEMSQKDADAAIRALPSPYARLKDFQANQKGAGAGKDAVAPNLPVKVTPSMTPELIRQRFKSGTKLILPDGSEGVVP